MTTEDAFGAMVVGAGPAGSAAAPPTAQAGLSVALIEHAARSGAKGLSGGLLFAVDVEGTAPGLAERPPVERRIIGLAITFLTADGGVSCDRLDDGLARPPATRRDHPMSPARRAKGQSGPSASEAARDVLAAVRAL